MAVAIGFVTSQVNKQNSQGNMNKIFAALLVSVGTVFGQGTVNFNNFVPAASIDAPIFDVDGVTRLAGTAFKAQLYAGTSLGTIAAIGADVPFFKIGRASCRERV